MAIFASLERSKVKKVKEEGCLVTVSVDVPAKEVEGSYQNALVQVQSRARLPGFRPGKAPLQLVETQFSDQIKQRVVDDAVRKMLPKALEEFKLRPVASPLVHAVQWEKGKALAFQITFEIPPKVEPKDYRKLGLSKKALPSVDHGVEERLGQIRESHARLEPAAEDAVGKDHYVLIDYEGTAEGKPLKGGKAENELVDMSSQQTLEGLAEGLLGGKKGEGREISVKLGGKDASLRVTIKEIKRKVLPALDDDLSKDLGFASLEELKSKVREAVAKESESLLERSYREQIDEQLAKGHVFALPPSLVQSQASSMLNRLKGQWLRAGRPWQEKDEPELLEKIKPEAERQLRLSYVLQAIAEKEALQATPEDLKKEEQAHLEGIESAEEKESLRKLFESQKDEIAAVIRERKAYELIRQNAKIKESEPT